MFGAYGRIRSRGMQGVLATACLAAWSPAAAVPAAEMPRPQSPRAAIVDPAVMPAGGLCRSCRDPHCRGCRAGGPHHHAGCRGGMCHPHCPVRPREFGYYGTQWRRWPGQGVVPVADIREATPALPPRSAVPGPDEESRGPNRNELPAPQEGIAPLPAVEPPAPLPAVEPTVEPQAEPALPEAEPAADVPLPAPAAEQTPPPAAPADERPMNEQPPAAAPAAEPAAPPSESDENLFEDSAAGPVRRRFVARRLEPPGRQAILPLPRVEPETRPRPVSAAAWPEPPGRDRPPAAFGPPAGAAPLWR